MKKKSMLFSINIASKLNVYSYLATPAVLVIKYDPSKPVLYNEIVIYRDAPRDSNHPWYN